MIRVAHLQVSVQGTHVQPFNNGWLLPPAEKWAATLRADNPLFARRGLRFLETGERVQPDLLSRQIGCLRGEPPPHVQIYNSLTPGTALHWENLVPD